MKVLQHASDFLSIFDIDQNINEVVCNCCLWGKLQWLKLGGLFTFARKIFSRQAVLTLSFDIR